MIKEEIEKAIEDGESVWVINNVIFEIELNEETCAVKDNMLIKNYSHPEFYKPQQICSIEYCFSTKAEAEHYLHHANVERVEKLPFLTWEEFKSGKDITFKAKNGHEFLLKAKQESIYLWWLETNNIWASWDLTEENFYKAYDECVKLFLGRED